MFHAPTRDLTTSWLRSWNMSKNCFSLIFSTYYYPISHQARKVELLCSKKLYHYACKLTLRLFLLTSMLKPKTTHGYLLKTSSKKNNSNKVLCPYINNIAKLERF
jgi:hypothetical protein